MESAITISLQIRLHWQIFEEDLRLQLGLIGLKKPCFDTRVTRLALLTQLSIVFNPKVLWFWLHC